MFSKVTVDSYQIALLTLGYWRAHMKVREGLNYRHKIQIAVVPSERKKKIDLEEVIKMVASIHASL